MEENEAITHILCMNCLDELSENVDGCLDLITFNLFNYLINFKEPAFRFFKNMQRFEDLLCKGPVSIEPY